MNLILRVTSYKGVPPAQPLTHYQDRGTATLGRMEKSDWVLSDPEKYLSSTHAEVKKTREGFVLTDVSSNGVFINNTHKPLGKGSQTALKHNDVIYLGEYVISVEVKSAEAAVPVAPVTIKNTAIDADPFADLGTDPIKDLGANPGDGLTEWEKTLHSERPTMEIIVDKGKPTPSPAFVTEDKSSELHDAFVIPRLDPDTTDVAATIPGSELPADWFKAEQEKANAKPLIAKPDPELIEQAETPDPTEQIESPIPVPIPVVKPAANPLPVPAAVEPTKVPTETIKMEPIREDTELPRDYQLAMKMFLKSAGVEDSIDVSEMGPETFALVGQLFKASIEGIREVILARSKLKNEMRLDVTTIRSTGNNPIKFSLNTEDAITRLLASQKEGFMHPAVAIEEVVDDLKAHQIAMLAGMQTALRSILEKFEPALLEQRLQKQNPLSAKVPLQREAKLWKLFGELYQDIQAEATEDFNHLFGQAFGKAYEKQIWQLKTQKSNPKNPGDKP